MQQHFSSVYLDRFCAVMNGSRIVMPMSRVNCSFAHMRPIAWNVLNDRARETVIVSGQAKKKTHKPNQVNGGREWRRVALEDQGAVSVWVALNSIVIAIFFVIIFVLFSPIWLIIDFAKKCVPFTICRSYVCVCVSIFFFRFSAKKKFAHFCIAILGCFVYIHSVSFFLFLFCLHRCWINFVYLLGFVRRRPSLALVGVFLFFSNGIQGNENIH